MTGYYPNFRVGSRRFSSQREDGVIDEREMIELIGFED